jgi:RHS repeat-associated protein
VRGLADEPRVDPFTAQVSYEVPLELPSGWGQLAPALSLVYSGVLGNGPLGIGWGMPGVRIQRSLRLGVPRFDGTDELELTGVASGRLVAVSANEYRIEGMGQTVRVRRVGDGFEVDDGTGTIHRLGVAAAARQESQVGGTWRRLGWLVEEQRNLAGESVRYEYQKDQGQVYLSRIVWGPNDVYSVDLVYQARADQVSSYREGFRVVTAKRLTEVRVNAFGRQRRAYQLRYDERFPLSRLAGVDSTGLDGAGAWPALDFEYAAAAAPAVTPVGGIQNWRLNGAGIILVDLDGDGATDLAQLADGGHSYRTNQKGSFGSTRSLPGNTQSITALQLQDIDGDARADLLQDTGDGWAVWKFGNGAWVSQAANLPGGTWPGTAGLALKSPDDTRFADLNGDGLIDAIRWDNDNLKIHQATTISFLAAREVERIGGAVLPTSLGRFQDTNGDGLDDYVELQIDRLDVYIGRGDGTFDLAVAFSYPFPGDRPSPDSLHVVDLDRDGLVDLVRVDLGQVRWYRGQANGTFASTAVTVANPEPLSADVVVAVTDANGNGSQDVVWSSVSGMWRMDVAGPTSAGMLVHSQNGLGMDVTFAYRSSHELSADARAAGDPWVHEVPIAMPVPVGKTTALGPGETTRVIQYAVRDGYWDVGERRFAGFLNTFVTTWGATPAETSSVQTRYHNGAAPNRVLRGKVLVEQVRDGTGRRLSMTSNVWGTVAVAGLPDAPLLRRATLRETRIRYEDTTPIRETRVTYEFDALGRTRRAVDQGRLDLDHDDSIRETMYADDGTTWVRDRICEEKLFTSGGELVSHEQHRFGDESQIHALCVVGKGWPRETRAWLANEARFVTRTAASYDAHGNLISVLEEGVTRTATYDPIGLFPVSESLALADRLLGWSLSWDGALGVATALGEPNGHETRATYDSLGRLTGLALDDRAPHSIIEYDWSAPFPTTTTWTFDGPLAEVGPWTGTWTPTGRWRQSVEVTNGLGEVRYRAVRSAQDEWIISDYRERDPNSRVVFAGRPVYSAALKHSARPVGMVGDQLIYDPLGRVIEQHLPTGATRTFSYTAFERTKQEDDLAPAHSVLDGKGRVILTERSLADGTHEVVEARYDAAGRPTRVWLSGGTVNREFTYDSLGRLVKTSDPDLGERTLRWDDADRLVEEVNGANQVVRYEYDLAGRLVERDAGAIHRYHYDQARLGADPGPSLLLGRLAWIEEPTGVIDIGYDELGRAIFSRRRIDDRVVEETTSHAASGLVLARAYDDGVTLSYEHDAAGRAIGVTDLWQILDQDAAGGVLHERFDNGVETTYARDPLGLVAKLTVRDSSGAAVYDVDVTRNGWTGITEVDDVDGTGLDHGASFIYDGFARLTAASIGSGDGTYSFGYGYDALHNMLTRTATGPSTLSLFAGTYRYGEGGKGPRQLTSIASVAGQTTHTFGYDAAGRQNAQDQLGLEFDALDQLVRVTGLPGGELQHFYGHDGQRVKTVAPGGAVSYFFAEGVAERAHSREHDIVVGDRIIARLILPPAAMAAAAPASGVIFLAVPWGAALILFGWAVVVAGRGTRPRRLGAAGMAGLLLASACSVGPTAEQVRSLQWGTPQITFMHIGVGAGPSLFTDSSGRVLEERRYEPFGDEIDARIRVGSSYVVGPPDLVTRDRNVLNKRTEAATGWSDHGARWLTPETGRWLTFDPPVKGPSPDFMDAPWDLHPYQYVSQNPITYWDPDGRDKKRTEKPGTVIVYGKHTPTQKPNISDARYRKMLIAAVNRTLTKQGPTLSVSRFSSAEDVRKVVIGENVKRLVIVSHGSYISPSLLPDMDEELKLPGKPVSGRSIGAVIRGSTVEEVVILGCDAATTGTAQELADGWGVGGRVVAWEGDVGLWGKPDPNFRRLVFTTRSAKRKEFIGNGDPEPQNNSVRYPPP